MEREFHLPMGLHAPDMIGLVRLAIAAHILSVIAHSRCRRPAEETCISRASFQKTLSDHKEAAFCICFCSPAHFFTACRATVSLTFMLSDSPRCVASI
jgi:hypothetical protein